MKCALCETTIGSDKHLKINGKEVCGSCAVQIVETCVDLVEGKEGVKAEWINKS